MIDQLAGVYFTDRIEEAGVTRPVAPGTRLLITFDSGRLTAHAGCNTMTGPFEVMDGCLVPGPLAMTLMAGPDIVMDQEQWLARFLDAQPRVRIDGDLVALTSGEQRLELRAESAQPQHPLVGTMWRLTEIRDDAGRTLVDAQILTQVRADALLSPAGVLSVQTGCNLGQAQVSVSPSEPAIMVGPMRLTRRACLPVAAPVESAMVAVLSGQVTTHVDGQQLRLSHPGADRILVFTAEAPGADVPPS